MSWWRDLLCRLGMHHWSEPGGHCEDCLVCDESLGPHPNCGVGK